MSPRGVSHPSDFAQDLQIVELLRPRRERRARKIALHSISNSYHSIPILRRTLIAHRGRAVIRGDEPPRSKLIFDNFLDYFVSAPGRFSFYKYYPADLNDPHPRNDCLMPFLTSFNHALLQRPSKISSPKASLVLFPKPMTAYANPGAHLM